MESAGHAPRERTAQGGAVESLGCTSVYKAYETRSALTNSSIDIRKLSSEVINGKESPVIGDSGRVAESLSQGFIEGKMEMSASLPAWGVLGVEEGGTTDKRRRQQKDWNTAKSPL